MSMFHELMMRKKEQIMYATIKGSLTENDGVFSGFSASNYLQTSTKLTNETNFEFSVTFTMPSTSLTNTLERLFMLSSGRNGLDIYTANGVSHPHAYLKNINNQDYSFNILSVTLEPNKTYTTKLIKQNTTYILECWSNGVKIGSETHSDEDININDFYYFGTTQSDRIFEGSIDLNNSYIKLGSTKYNLQAVVGYTVVGSPTITDGVVSGFSASDYLTTVYGVFPDFEEDFELQIKFTTGANVSNSLLIGTNTSLINGFRIVSSQLNMTLRYDVAKQNTVSYTLVANTTYYAKALKKGTSLICSLYDENNVLLATHTTNLPETGFIKGNYMYVGYGTSGAFEGSIYLNETYIKVNNKLWFNGQQA